MTFHIDMPVLPLRMLFKRPNKRDIEKYENILRELEGDSNAQEKAHIDEH